MSKLASCLPTGCRYSWVHVHTKAYKCKAPTATPGDSFKAKHLFLLADDAHNVIVFGVEVYIYFGLVDGHMTRHIFVPKADTTGLGGRFSAAAVMEAFLDLLLCVDVSVYFALAEDEAWGKGVLDADKTGVFETKGAGSAACNREAPDNGVSGNTNHEETTRDQHQCNHAASEFPLVDDLRRLSRRIAQRGCDAMAADKHSAKRVQKVTVARPKSETVRISMFTKAADAYLFPKSEKNAGKHVASGNELFKWWLAVLHRVVSKHKGWVLAADIPGSDTHAVQRFLPAGCTVGSIYPPDGDVLQTIPVFPDDPKGRFLEHLVVENRYRMSVAQFWHELGYRQEFRLGNVVGIIGAEGPSHAKSAECGQTKVQDPTNAQGSTLIPVKGYKKLRDYIKGHDYSKLDDIQEVWVRGTRDLCERYKMKLDVVHTIGTRPEKVAQESRASEPVNVMQVKKRPAINNIDGLVKKKRK